MNKYMIITLCLLSLHLQLITNQAYAQSSSSTVREQTIKHELARMPEQSSWSIERWNINDVDFDLKEISKATRNQLAKFELKVEIPGKSTSKLKNPIAAFNLSDKINEEKIMKNKVVYLTQVGRKTFSNYWNINDLQLKDLNQKVVRIVKKNSTEYFSYEETDFYLANRLTKQELYQGEVDLGEQTYLLYRQDNSEFKYSREWTALENEFNFDRASTATGQLDLKKLATLPKVEELIDPSVQHVLLVDKKTMLPAYYCDRLSVYKYIYPTEEELAEFEMPQPPENIKETLQWYIENVLPKKERR